MLFMTSHVHEAFQAEALNHKTKRTGQLWLKSAQERNVQVPSDSVNCKTAFTQSAQNWRMERRFHIVSGPKKTLKFRSTCMYRPT